MLKSFVHFSDFKRNSALFFFLSIGVCHVLQKKIFFFLNRCKLLKKMKPPHRAKSNLFFPLKFTFIYNNME